MSIGADGFVDWAVRLPSHPAKVYSEPNRGLGLIGHSVVGNLGVGNVPARFLSDAREPGAPSRFTADAAASSMFILYKDGTLGQCYPVTASTWTSGGREANTSYWAIEADGGAPGNETEPLTDAAVRSLMRLCGEFEAHTGRKVVAGETFVEHGAIARKLGYAATACPSFRYGRFYDALEGIAVPGLGTDALQRQLDEMNRWSLMREDIRRLASSDDTTLLAVHRYLAKGGSVPDRDGAKG